MTNGGSVSGAEVSPLRSPKRRRSSSGARKRLPSAQRRQQIIDAARELFVRVGREGVSTHQIAEAAGVNVAIVYKHFRSSAEVFDVAVRQSLEGTVRERISEGVSAEYSGDTREQLVRLHEALLTTLIDVAPTLGIVLFGDRDTGRIFYRDCIDPLIDQWIVARYRALDPGRRPVDYTKLGRTIFGIHLSNAIFAHLLGVQLDVPAVAREISDFFLLGYRDL